jgi:hypothetical protein
MPDEVTPGMKRTWAFAEGTDVFALLTSHISQTSYSQFLADDDTQRHL